MGSKNCMLAVSSGDPREILAAYPVLDKGATVETVAALFPDQGLQVSGEAELDFCYPRDGEVFAACYPGLTILGTGEVGIDYPSQLPPRFLAHAAGRRVILHAMHSVVSWFAYGLWENGTLVRSLSLSFDDDVIEDLGDPLPFEAPYWAGAHDDPDEEPEVGREPMNSFGFHPLEMGEEALRSFFGFQQEGSVDPALLEPERLPLLRFERRAQEKPHFEVLEKPAAPAPQRKRSARRSRNWWSRLLGG